MDRQAREAYLEAQVMTATPQKLRLMLIDGAIHFARQTLHFWEQEQNQEAFEALVRCREIVSELLAGVSPEKTELTERVAGLYVFLFRTLTEAQARRDAAKMQDVLRVLEIERETWRELCEKMPESPQGWLERQTRPQEITSSDVSGSDEAAPVSEGGLALEA